eukprot:4123422-Amphidinium_carterae.1
MRDVDEGNAEDDDEDDRVTSATTSQPTMKGKRRGKQILKTIQRITRSNKVVINDNETVHIEHYV